MLICQKEAWKALPRYGNLLKVALRKDDMKEPERMRASGAGKEVTEKKSRPFAGVGFSGWLKATPVAMSRTCLGTRAEQFWTRAYWHGCPCSSRAALRQSEVQVAWQAQHSGSLRVDCVASTAVLYV